MLIVPPSAFRTGTSLINVLSNLGLTSGLKLCLDAGDKNSYDGSSQTWKDLSGNGTDFYRGSGSGSDSADPTFNGTAGNLSGSEYFGFDGDDSLILASGSNPTWVQDLHKAGTKYGVAAWVYRPTPGSSDSVIFSTRNANVAETGFAFFWDDGSTGFTNGPATIIVNGGTQVLSASGIAAASISIDHWNFLAISWDSVAEARHCAWIGADSGSSSKALSFGGTPSSGNAAQVARIGNDQNGGNGLVNGSRLACFAVWGGVAPAEADLFAIGNATKSRFGY